jgi:hypothetical protein
MIITVSIQVPMQPGDTYQTPFGPGTVTAAEAVSGYFNKTISASRVVTSSIDATALANHGADLVAGLAGQSS